jgi:OmpA-OmpF porin, OOP family
MENNMKQAKAVVILGLAGCAAISSPLAVAADTGWYGGVAVGTSKAKIDDGRINNELQSAGFAAASTTKDERDAAYKLFGGYQFNRNFALEGGYFDLGRYGFTSTTTGPAGTLTDDMQIMRGVNLDTVGTLPITGKFSALGRLGLQNTEVKDTYAGTGGVAVSDTNPTKRATNYKLGLGVQYDLSEKLKLRGEWERYRITDTASNRGDVDVFSAGMVVKF